jgi:hypothetical protein
VVPYLQGALAFFRFFLFVVSDPFPPFSFSSLPSPFLPFLPFLPPVQIPDGKPENVFAFSGEAKNKKYATEIITECNEAWKNLISGQSDAGKIDLCVSSASLSLCSFSAPLLTLLRPCRSSNTTVDSPFKTTADEVAADSRQPAAPIDASIDKTFFISGHVRLPTPPPFPNRD